MYPNLYILHNSINMLHDSHIDGLTDSYSSKLNDLISGDTAGGWLAYQVCYTLTKLIYKLIRKPSKLITVSVIYNL